MAPYFLGLVLVFALVGWISDAATLGVQQVVAGITITAPPQPRPTGECTRENLFKRGTAPTSCSYGACGSDCLTQGAFCCNPGGTLATAPNWICDDGICVTSVRGSTGIVDCYDPENPAGTTQSCLDFVPTTTCNPTDKCYQCSSDVPYCHWQTYIDPASPTLRWFSCINSTQAHETFFATSVTQNLLATSRPATNNTTSLPTGALIGIVVGGAAALIIIVVLITCVCMKRKKESKSSDPLSQRNSISGSTLKPRGSVTLKDMPPQELPIPDQEGAVALWATGKPMTEAASTPISELPGHAIPSPRDHLDPFIQSPHSVPSQPHTPVGMIYSSGSDTQASPEPYPAQHSISSRPSMPNPSLTSRSQASSPRHGAISPHSPPHYYQAYNQSQRTSSHDSQGFLDYSEHGDAHAQNAVVHGQPAPAYGQPASTNAQQYGTQQVYYPPPPEQSSRFYSDSRNYHDTGQRYGN